MNLSQSCALFSLKAILQPCRRESSRPFRLGVILYCTFGLLIATQFTTVVWGQTLRQSQTQAEDVEHLGRWSVMFGDYNGGDRASDAWVKLLTNHGPLLEDVEANLIEIGFIDDQLRYFLLGGIFSNQQEAADLCILMRIRKVECGLVQIDRNLISLARPMLSPDGNRLSPQETIDGLGAYLPNFKEALAKTDNEITRLDRLYGYWMRYEATSRSHMLPNCPTRRLVLSPMSVKILDAKGQATEMSCNFISKSPEEQQQSHIHINCEDGSRANVRQIDTNHLVLEHLFEPDEESPRSVGSQWTRCLP